MTDAVTFRAISQVFSHSCMVPYCLRVIFDSISQHHWPTQETSFGSITNTNTNTHTHTQTNRHAQSFVTHLWSSCVQCDQAMVCIMYMILKVSHPCTCTSGHTYIHANTQLHKLQELLHGIEWLLYWTMLLRLGLAQLDHEISNQIDYLSS